MVFDGVVLLSVQERNGEGNGPTLKCREHWIYPEKPNNENHFRVERRQKEGSSSFWTR